MPNKTKYTYLLLGGKNYFSKKKKKKKMCHVKVFVTIATISARHMLSYI